METPDSTTNAVIITGGGSGIGQTISMTLAQSYALLLVGRTEASLRRTCAAIRHNGGRAAYLVGDVANEHTASRAVERVQQLGWRLQAVICNAGVGKSSRTHELSSAQWQKTFATNVHGSFYFAQAVLPIFMQQHFGTICFINSLAGIKGYAYDAAYVASKHAIVGLSKSLALEYGKYGISSVAICPGFVESSMTDRTIQSVASRKGTTTSEARRIVERTNPQRRIIPAQEVSEIVNLVCSNKVPSLAGNPLILSGGA